MITKSYYNDGRSCRVTFRYCPDRHVETVHLISDHDDWDMTARPMVRRKDGCFSTSLVLPGGSRIQFRYLVDGSDWVNDDQADEYTQNDHGTTDAVVVI